MALDLSKFLRVRPRLFHLTARTNLPLIHASGCLRPAASLLKDAGESRLAKTRRKQSLVVTVAGKAIHIRDQAPLHAGNLALPAGCQFEDFVEHLNQHVFFWPGTAEGPISYGKRHFERYGNEGNVVMVLDTKAVLDANPELAARFCRFNSGSPRCSGGKPSPRSLGTFATAADYEGTPSSIVEVVFRGPVLLPPVGIAVKAPMDLV